MSKEITLNISSDNRDLKSQKSSNFTVSFNDPRFFKITSIKLETAVFTNTVSNVNQSNNIFTYRDSVGYISVGIPVGQYNITQILSALSLALLASARPIVASFTYDTITHKISCTSCSPAISFFDVDGSNINNMATLLGLFNVSSLVTSYVFPHLPDISGLDKIIIKSHYMASHGGVYIKTLNDNGTRKNISVSDGTIKVIPVVAQFGYKESYINMSDHVIVYDEPKNLSICDIQITNYDGTEIDLQGSRIFLSFLVNYD